MARTIGTYNRAYNNEVTIPSPIDARTLVETFDDLTLKSNWVTKKGQFIAFNGLVVTVANVQDTSKNGLYYLFDPEADPNEWEDPDVENEANWHKLVNLSDLVEMAVQVGSLISELTEIKNRLTSLEERKLYDELGGDPDGAVSQRAVSEELAEKAEFTVDPLEEMITLGTDLNNSMNF